MAAKTIYDRIFDILVEHAGAPERMREEFCQSLGNGCREFRFQGSLGFGGKFWPERWQVTCYSEDETPERLAVIKATNAALKRLYDDVVGKS